MPEFSFTDITPLAYAMSLAVVFIAAVVQSCMGMGFGQIAAPLLLLIHSNFVPVPILIMGMVVSTLNSVKKRHDIDARELGLALAGRIIGSVLAAMVLVYIAGQSLFSLLFAGIILLAVGFQCQQLACRARSEDTAVGRWSIGFHGHHYIGRSTAHGYRLPAQSGTQSAGHFKRLFRSGNFGVSAGTTLVWAFPPESRASGCRSGASIAGRNVGFEIPCYFY